MTEGNQSSKGRIGVLICDDVAQIRALLTATIERQSTLQLVGEAANGEQVIAAAKRLQPDVILLDLSMPGMTGFEALPHLKRVAPHARIIVLSGFSADIMAEDVLAQGADRYLEKGASPHEIAAVIQEVAAIPRTSER